MIVADQIYQRVLTLPETLQAEVLDFVDFLLTKFESPSHNGTHTRTKSTDIRGKYAFVQTSSELFAARKQAEIKLEG